MNLGCQWVGHLLGENNDTLDELLLFFLFAIIFEFVQSNLGLIFKAPALGLVQLLVIITHHVGHLCDKRGRLALGNDNEAVGEHRGIGGRHKDFLVDGILRIVHVISVVACCECVTLFFLKASQL